MIRYATAIEGYTARLEDRVEVLRVGDSLLIGVADGAGGRAGGAAAADTVVQLVRDVGAGANTHALPSAARWCKLLEALDRRAATDPAVGETTAVVMSVSGGRIEGASVGDSAAWLIDDRQVLDLTSSQERKPGLCTGQAIMVPFAARLETATLLVATDGLLKYTSRETIVRLARAQDLQDAAKSLIDAVRLRSGKLNPGMTLPCEGSQRAVMVIGNSPE